MDRKTELKLYQAEEMLHMLREIHAGLQDKSRQKTHGLTVIEKIWLEAIGEFLDRAGS